MILVVLNVPSENNCLNLTHVFWDVVMIFHPQISNPNFPVLWIITYAIFTDWRCVFNVPVIS